MGKCATAGTCLATLVRMALPIVQEAERQCPHTGPGAKLEIPDWFMGALIMVAVLKRKKSKSSQYRFLSEPHHRRLIAEVASCATFPSRSTFFRRYRRAHTCSVQRSRCRVVRRSRRARPMRRLSPWTRA